MKAQLYFLNNVLLPLLDMAVNRLVKVYFCDGVHLIYGYEGGKYWCKNRVCVKSAYGRKRVNCLGFLDAVSHKVETVMNVLFECGQRLQGLKASERTQSR